MVDNLIDCLLYEKSFEKAVRLVMKVVQSIMDGSIDISLLVISKSLSKESKDYTSTAPHVTLSKKLEIRDVHTAPRMGDRVPYVITASGDKNIKTHEKAEDPLYAIEHNLQIDRQYYLMNQLRNPVERILEPLLPGITARLFSPTHCTIYLPPSVASKAKKLTTARTGTGASESRFALLSSGPKGIPAPTIASESVTAMEGVISTSVPITSLPPVPPPPPPPKPAPKKKAAAKRDDPLAKLVSGQTSLFTNHFGKPELLKPLDEVPQLKSWAKAPPKKPKAHIAGQTAVSDTKEFVKAPERDLTKPEEGYIAVDIRYKVVAGSPVVSKDSIARFGYMLPKCLSCEAVITPAMLTAADLAQDRVAPVCALCRTSWASEGKDVQAEMARLKANYLKTVEEADAQCKTLWDICVKCQNVKAIEDVPICGAKDCKNFYPRTTAKVRRGRLDNMLDRLQNYKLKDDSHVKSTED